MLYALVASILWVPTSLYAIGYMRGHNEDNQTLFACFAIILLHSGLLLPRISSHFFVLRDFDLFDIPFGHALRKCGSASRGLNIYGHPADNIGGFSSAGRCRDLLFRGHR